ALTQVSVAWANTNLPASVAWAKSLPESSGKAVALMNIAYEAARMEPLTSLELAVMLPPSPERDRLLVHATSQWVALDPGAATTWAQSISDADLKQTVLAATVVALASQNGASAANLAANYLQPGGDQDRAVVAIVQRWAESSPRAAADWVSQFPDTTVRQI